MLRIAVFKVFLQFIFTDNTGWVFSYKIYGLPNIFVDFTDMSNFGPFLQTACKFTDGWQP
jgi:hypothetical protein